MRATRQADQHRARKSRSRVGVARAPRSLVMGVQTLHERTRERRSRRRSPKLSSSVTFPTRTMRYVRSWLAGCCRQLTRLSTTNRLSAALSRSPTAPTPRKLSATSPTSTRIRRSAIVCITMVRDNFHLSLFPASIETDLPSSFPIGFPDNEQACGEDSSCMNRLMQIECVQGDCKCGENCQNQR